MSAPRSAVLVLFAVLLAAPLALGGEGVWTTTFPFGGDLLSGGLVVAPADPLSLYGIPVGRPVYRTTDGATTWSNPAELRPVPFDRVDVRWVATGEAPDTVYLLASTSSTDRRSEVFRSLDGGGGWEVLTQNLPAATTAFAVVPGQPDRLVAGLAGGDIYGSANAGATWRRLGSPGFAAEVLRMVPDPTDPATLYAGLAPEGLYRSRDGGATWMRLAAGTGMGAVIDLLVHPADPSLLFVVDHVQEPPDGCGSDGERLFRSIDGGASWERFDFDCDLPWDRRAPGRRLALGPSGELYVALDVDLWKGSILGSQWLPLEIAGGVEVRTVVTAEPAAGATVYAGTAAGVFASHDGGASWQQASHGMRAVGHRLHAHQVAYDASDPAVVYSGAWHGGRRAGGGFRSLDGGVTWEPMALPGGDATSFATHPSRPGLVYAAHNGVMRSFDRGRTWEQLSPQDGCFCYAYGDLRMDPFDPEVLYYAGSTSTERPDAVFRSTDGGDTWSVLEGLHLGQQTTLAVDPVRPGVLFAGGVLPERPLPLAEDRFRVVARWRTPGGAAGYAEPVPLTRDAGYFWFFREDNVELVVKVIDGCPVNGHFWVFLAGLTNVEVRLRVADLWTHERPEYANPQGEAFQAIQDTAALSGCDAVEPAAEPRADDFLLPLHGLFRSDDGGGVWSRLPRGEAPSPGEDRLEEWAPRQVRVHALNPDRVWLAAGNVFRSDDGGATWVTVLAGENATAVAVDPSDPDVAYVATFNTTGFHRSVDGGETWETINDGLPLQAPMEALAVDPLDPRHVLAGTWAGLWEIRLPPPSAGP